MTTAADYQNLITSEHAGKPKFMAMVGLVAGCFSDVTNFLNSLPGEFDIDTARWAQLDMIGQWVGLDRSLRATVPGLYVQAPPSNAVPLTDPDYQVLLRGKIGANSWNGSINDAYYKLTGMFGNTGSQLFMVDHQNMSMDIAVSGNVPDSSFKAALTGGYMQVRPAGVQASYWFPTAPGGPLFGLDVENQFISGLDVGVWASST